MSTSCEEGRLFRAAMNGDLDEVKRLVLDCGADPNVRNNDGWTPLHSAAFRCRIDMARVLFDHGLISLLRDNEEMTPLDYCNNCEEFIEELRRRSTGTTAYE
jgi:ankyrin repeat protein